MLSLATSFGADTNSPTSGSLAQAQATAPGPDSPAVTGQTDSTPNLPYGVEDILKLSRAQISEDIILNYIHNSGIVYNLKPQDILYLRSQGVSDTVLSAMLNQRKLVADAAAAQAAAAQAQSQPPAPPATPPDQTASGQNPVAPVYTQPPPAAPQPAPSSVYVIPYPPAENAYDGYPGYPGYPVYPDFYGGYYGPYYGSYYGYYGGPVVSLGFGFGGWGHYDHDFHGGHFEGGHFGGGHFGGGHFGGGHSGGGHFGGGHR